MRPRWARWYAVEVPTAPPPMTTTRARVGRSSLTGAPRGRGGRSKRGLAASSLRRLPLLHRPPPEVELDGARALLDHPPEHPAVPGHPAPQLGPRDEGVEGVVVTAVVGAAQLGERVGAEAGLGDGVAELEGGLVHPRVLVVDDPQVAAVVEDVRGEEVVVAGHERLGCHGEGGLHGVEARLEVEVALRQPEAPLPHDLEVAAADGEHVEPPDERGSGVQPAQRGREPREVGADVGVLPRAPGQEPDDEDPATRQVPEDGRPDPGGRRGEGVRVLDVAVDPEQAALGRGDPHDGVDAVVGADPVVVVGQPTGQGRDVSPLPGEDGDVVEQVLELLHVGVRRRATRRRRRAPTSRGARGRSRRHPTHRPGGRRSSSAP